MEPTPSPDGHQFESLPKCFLPLDEFKPVLRVATLTGFEAEGRCTQNDVATRGGYVGWSDRLRSLRDQLVSRGWTAGRDHGFETVVSPDQLVQIAVAAGDPNTGLPNRMPTTKRDRGPLTGLAADSNTQMNFPTNVSPLFAPRVSPDIQSWFLLSYEDRVLGEIRFELSRPTAFLRHTPESKRGYLSDFDPRIILDPIRTDVRDDNDDFGDDQIEIDIRPKGF